MCLAAFVQSTSVSVWCRGTSCTNPMRGSNLVGVAQMCGDPSVPTARRRLCNSLSLLHEILHIVNCNHVYFLGIQRLKDSVFSSNLQDPFLLHNQSPPSQKDAWVVGPQEAYDVDPVLALDVWSSAAQLWVLELHGRKSAKPCGSRTSQWHCQMAFQITPIVASWRWLICYQILLEISAMRIS